MSLGSRIKERREQLGMTRQDLANQIGVTAQAIGNYETEYSTPKIELLYKLFQALDCDANYLYQDEMREAEPSKELVFTKHEIQMIEKYRSLDSYGSDLVDTVLEKEFERCREEEEFSIPMSDEELKKLPLDQVLKFEPYIDNGMLKVARKRKK